jgi:Superfamily I DNA and RNA helicases
MRRLEQRYDHIMIDEIQDMAGYDLEVLELMLKTKLRISLVGDHRQATFRTNQAKKHSGYSGTSIIKKFEEWHEAGLAQLKRQQHTHRCHQGIADLADSFFPSEPPTRSLNTTVTGHDGVFLVPSAKVPEYVQRFSPQALRFDKRTNCGDLSAMNFGESKGMTFDRTLIFPHGGAKKWISTGSLESVEKSLAKMYVGVTRARYSVGLVFDGLSKLKNVKRFD